MCCTSKLWRERATIHLKHAHLGTLRSEPVTLTQTVPRQLIRVSICVFYISIQYKPACASIAKIGGTRHSAAMLVTTTNMCTTPHHPRHCCQLTHHGPHKHTWHSVCTQPVLVLVSSSSTRAPMQGRLLINAATTQLCSGTESGAPTYTQLQCSAYPRPLNHPPHAPAHDLSFHHHKPLLPSRPTHTQQPNNHCMRPTAAATSKPLLVAAAATPKAVKKHCGHGTVSKQKRHPPQSAISDTKCRLLPVHVSQQ